MDIIDLKQFRSFQCPIVIRDNRLKRKENYLIDTINEKYLDRRDKIRFVSNVLYEEKEDHSFDDQENSSMLSVMTRYCPTWSCYDTENIGETSRTSNTHFQFINLSTILKEKEIQAHLLSQTARRKLLSKNININHGMALKDTHIYNKEADLFSEIDSFRGAQKVVMDRSLQGSVYSDESPMLDLKPKPRLSGMSVEQSTMILEFVKKQFKHNNKTKNSFENDLDNTLLGGN